MSTINTKATKSTRRTGLSRKDDAKATAASHSNFMAGTSYDVTNPLARLRMAAASSFFGEPVYYEGRATKPTDTSPHIDELAKTLGIAPFANWAGLSSAARMEKAIDEALSFDAEGTLLEADRAEQAMATMLAQLHWWASALRKARASVPYGQFAAA